MLITTKLLEIMLMILTLSSCISTASPNPTGIPETQAPVPVSGEPGELPQGAVIVLRRSGGFAGLDEEWTLYDDGTVTAKDGRQWQTSPEEVSTLLEGLEALGFFELEAAPSPVIPCCDRFSYELTAVAGERVHTAATYDGATDTPAGLWQAIEVVTEFLKQAEAQAG